MHQAGLLFALSVCVYGQTNGVIRGPLSGYVGDAPTRSIRPIVGMLGGAYLGKAILGEVTQAWVAPEGARAVILRGDRYFLVSALDTSALRIDETPMGVSGPNAFVAWAADGTSVVVAGDGGLQVASWQEIERAWRVGPVRVIPSGVITAVAVDSKFGALAVAISQGDGTDVHMGSVWGGELEIIYRGQSVCALAYAHTGTTLYVSDKGTGNILSLMRSGARAEGLITSDPEEYRDVIALAVADDDSAVYSVHRNRRVVVKHHLADHSIRIVEVEGTPNGLFSISAAGFYVVALREKSSDAVLAFDARSELHYFIPAGGAQ